MKIDVLTLFPEAFEPLNIGIMKRAQDNGIITLGIHDIREYSLDKHKKCDDYAFGGGAGMVMMAQPVCDAIRAVDPEHKALRIYMSPKGKTFCQQEVLRLSKYENILLLCGHYEGIDQRALDKCIDEEISVGDYVLMGGELPTMIVAEAVARYVPGVLHSEDSVKEESFTDSLLEYPQYTRPAVFEGEPVPEVLLSGHHGNIAKWRMEQRIEITAKLRPDLLANSVLPEEKKKKPRRRKKIEEAPAIIDGE